MYWEMEEKKIKNELTLLRHISAHDGRLALNNRAHHFRLCWSERRSSHEEESFGSWAMCGSSRRVRFFLLLKHIYKIFFVVFCWMGRKRRKKKEKKQKKQEEKCFWCTKKKEKRSSQQVNRRQMEITKKNPPFALATIELKRTLFIVSIRPNFLSRKKKKKNNFANTKSFEENWTNKRNERC